MIENVSYEKKLEDECHFVLLYDAIRTQYIVRYYLTRPRMLKLIELVSSKCKTQVKNLATLFLKRLFRAMIICFYLQASHNAWCVCVGIFINILLFSEFECNLDLLIK